MFTRRNSSNVTSVGSTDSRGFFMATRRGATDVEVYRNGSSIVAHNAASVSIPNDVTELFAINGTNLDVTQISIALIMDGVSDAEAAAINTIIETYMDAIGKGVIP